VNAYLVVTIPSSEINLNGQDFLSGFPVGITNQPIFQLTSNSFLSHDKPLNPGSSDQISTAI
jgi:hypothetical protein